MNRAELLEKLRELKPWLEEQGIVNPRLFGSFARDEAGPDSDVDLLVEVSKPRMGAWEFLGIESALADRLGRPVEFCSESVLHRLMKPQVLAEAVRV